MIALFSRSLMIWKVLDWTIYFTLYVYIRYTHTLLHYDCGYVKNCQDISFKCSKRPSTDSNCNCLAIHDPPNHRAACSLPWCLTSNPEKELCPKDMTGIPNGGMDMNGLETGENEILCGIRKSRIRPMSFQGWKKHRAGGVDLVGRLFNCQHFVPKYGLCIPACEMETSAIKFKLNLSTLHPYHTQKRTCIQTRCDTCKINPRVYPYKHWDEQSLLKNG